jgi:hypothetical protein
MSRENVSSIFTIAGLRMLDFFLERLYFLVGLDGSICSRYLEILLLEPPTSTSSFFGCLVVLRFSHALSRPGMASRSLSSKGF